MNAAQTALILIGYQNDYFASSGILYGVIEDSARVTGTLENTVDLIDRLHPTPVLMVSTPIAFTENYDELVEPVGILKTIKKLGAFKMGTVGAETIPEITHFGDRIVEVPGKRGLNAFSNTDLEDILSEYDIKSVVIAGAVTSICVDSTGRAASERGYSVGILSDCTVGRTVFEQEFYCKSILPLYAEVTNHMDFVQRLNITS
ncbi:MAG: cysteine hydrolase [Gammaproteobacteria bacterium]|jgi:nicotinamidase-related amidase